MIILWAVDLFVLKKKAVAHFVVVCYFLSNEVNQVDIHLTFCFVLFLLSHSTACASYRSTQKISWIPSESVHIKEACLQEYKSESFPIFCHCAFVFVRSAVISLIINMLLILGRSLCDFAFLYDSLKFGLCIRALLRKWLVGGARAKTKPIEKREKNQWNTPHGWSHK